jgi:hypothetical protein
VDKLFTINVTNVNDAPIVTGFTKVGAEDNTLTFTTADFISQFSDQDGNALAAVRIDSLPAGGVLKLNGTAVTAGQVIAAADLALLTFVPNLNFSGAVTFEYNATDGALFAANPARITLNILSAQQQAEATSQTVQALVSTGVLTSGQGRALSINLQNNNGDAGKVRAFLNKVQAFFDAGILNQYQANALLEPGNSLLLSVSRR